MLEEQKKTLLLFVLSGILLGLCFSFVGEISLGFLGWFAFSPFFYATQRLPNTKSYMFALLLLIVLFIILHSWWLFMYSFKANILVLITQGPLAALPFIAYYFIHQRRGYFLALITFPFVYTLNEFFINSLSFAMPTYFMAYSQASYYWLVQFADIGGMYSVTFWAVALNSLLFLAYLRGNQKLMYVTISFVVTPIGYSYYSIYLNAENWLSKNPKETTISLIQTNQNVYELTDSSTLNKAFNELITLADSAVTSHQPDLVVLPESAIPVPFFKDSALFSFTKNTMISWQTSVALGFQDIPESAKPNHFENKAFIFTPQLAHFWDSLGLTQDDIIVYQKEVGLPFVETNPFFEDKLSFTGRCLISGEKEETFIYNSFAGEAFKTSLAICWDQMQAKKFHSAVSLGATFLILMNNDAWFGKTNGPKQLKAITQLRAIENRRTVARCSNGGISCFIDPFGRSYGEVPWFISTISTEKVQCVFKKSFYTQYPNFVIIACSTVLILLFLIPYFLQNSRTK